jgi:hypothetical protein
MGVAPAVLALAAKGVPENATGTIRVFLLSAMVLG